MQCHPLLRPLLFQIILLSLNIPKLSINISWTNSRPDACLVLFHANTSKTFFEVLFTLPHYLSPYRLSSPESQTNSAFVVTCQRANKDFPSVNSHIHKEQFPTRFDTAARVADTVSSFSIYISDLDPLRTLYLIVPRLHHVRLWHNHLTIHLWCFHHTSPLVIYFFMIHLWCFYYTSPLVIYLLMIHLGCFHHTSPLVVYYLPSHLWRS